MNNIVGIVGAMDVEVSTLCQKLQNKEVVKFGGLEFNHGFLNSKEVVIVKSGVGKVNLTFDFFRQIVSYSCAVFYFTWTGCKTTIV